MLLAYLLMAVLAVVGILLMIIVLLQRGRGGGLAGAFGGVGGQSAFGTKAGDVFTKITIVMAVIWVGLAGANVYVLREAGRIYVAEDVPDDPTVTAPRGVEPPDQPPELPTPPDEMQLPDPPVPPEQDGLRDEPGEDGPTLPEIDANETEGAETPPAETPAEEEASAEQPDPEQGDGDVRPEAPAEEDEEKIEGDEG